MLETITPNQSPISRTGKRPVLAEVQEAARLCFRDDDTDEVIARKLGISRRTLARWKHRPAFQTEFEREESAFMAKIKTQTDAYIAQHIAQRNEEMAAMRAQITARRGTKKF